MGRKSQKPKSKKGAGKKQQEPDGTWLWVDPKRVRFQHSRIRPYFSGCGRSVTETLESIRRHELSPSDLPPIQVIVGPEDESGPWYFSLNNRRLWVLKRCREENLLENNVIRVRVRTPRSASDLERYTLANCAVEAKFMREKDPSGDPKEQQANGTIKEPSQTSNVTRATVESLENQTNTDRESIEHSSDKEEDSEDSDDSDSDEDSGTGYTNRFSALM